MKKKQNRKQKWCVVLAGMVMCIMVTMTAFGGLIREIYYTYNVNMTYHAIESYTTWTSGMTMTLNTRPTSGQAGASVWVAGSNGSSYKLTFPYQISINPLSIPLSTGVTYTTSVAAISGTVSGILTKCLYN